MSAKTTNSADSLASRRSRPFVFRPSKLSAVTEKMWKKDNCPSGDTVVLQHNENFNLVEKPSHVGSQETSSASEKSAASSSPCKSFVFGQKIGERVVVKDAKADKCDTHQKESTVSDFKSLQKNGDGNQMAQSSTADEKLKPTLEESAKEYEETVIANTKVKLAENVDVKTGEEEEFNIIQVTCKLHVFDTSKESWEERGGALLRLNEGADHSTSFESCDTSTFSPEDHKDSARIVVRLNGSLKVIVNSRLWNEMLIERVSPKRLKLSAIDAVDKSVILYLVTAGQMEIDKLEHILKQKLETLKEKHNEAKNKRKQKDEKNKKDKKQRTA